MKKYLHNSVILPKFQGIFSRGKVLTHFDPVLLFYTPWKHVLGGIGKQHWAVMGNPVSKTYEKGLSLITLIISNVFGKFMFMVVLW